MDIFSSEFDPNEVSGKTVGRAKTYHNSLHQFENAFLANLFYQAQCYFHLSIYPMMLKPVSNFLLLEQMLIVRIPRFSPKTYLIALMFISHF